nr:hypothetical protein BaRGS_029196 [Batillaria attramentaria]
MMMMMMMMMMTTNDDDDGDDDDDDDTDDDEDGADDDDDNSNDDDDDDEDDDDESEQVSLHLNQPVNYCVSRGIMANRLRYLRSAAKRDRRNYVIFRDAGLLLDDVIQYYERVIANVF